MKKGWTGLRAICLGLAVAAAGLTGCSPEGLALEGVVETNIYGHYSEVSGKIIEMPVELGQEVKDGEVIAVLDDTQERHALEQLEQTLAIKQANLADLTRGVDPEALKQGQNNVSLAELAYEKALLSRDRAKEDYEKALALWEGGALTQAELDRLKLQLDLAEGAVESAAMQLDNAKQQLALLEKDLPREKVAVAQADLELTEIQIRQGRERLAKYTVTALVGGTVISKNYLPGSIVAPGYDLVDIAATGERQVVIYVPRDQLSRLSFGQDVVVRAGKQEYQGTISFIDVKAQYTPKDMQTQANRNKESMKVKVRLGPEVPLKVGEKGQVVIP